MNIPVGNGILAQIQGTSTDIYIPKNFKMKTFEEFSKHVSTSSNYFVANQHINASLQNMWHDAFYLKSKRVFNPDSTLIKTYFHNRNTIEFIKECKRLSKQSPGLKLIRPFHCQPVSEEDVENLKIFLHLFNAKLIESYNPYMFFTDMSKISNVIYSIELYDEE